jgi:hypothetical protein
MLLGENMGPWASAIVAAASLAGAFFAVMGFRGLIEALDDTSGRCARCGRAAYLPLPPRCHECRRCHYGGLSLAHPFSGRARLRR